VAVAALSCATAATLPTLAQAPAKRPAASRAARGLMFIGYLDSLGLLRRPPSRGRPYPLDLKQAIPANASRDRRCSLERCRAVGPGAGGAGVKPNTNDP
jgi:hypothetical protein